MSKIMWKPGTFIYPLPAVMVSCRYNGKVKYNNSCMDWNIKYKPSNGIYISKTK